ncbi:hypothetical protein ACUXST_002224 [Sphingomonas sp. F9_3S_D5_B_2]
MLNRHSPELLLWRFDLALVSAAFRRTFNSVFDILLLIAVLVGVLIGIAYAIDHATTVPLAREAAVFILLSWPLAYWVARSARKRLSWFEECTPLCAVALQPSAGRNYLLVPLLAAAGLLIGPVLVAAPEIVSRFSIGSLTAVGLICGNLHGLVWASSDAVPFASVRGKLPPGHGARLLAFAVMRSQLFGLPPRPVVLTILAATLFCSVAAAFLVANGSTAAVAAAAVTVVTLAAFSRPDFQLSKCAPRAGFGPSAVIVAHGLLPLGIALVSTLAAFLVRGASAAFLALTWGAWALFFTSMVLSALRFPRVSKQAAVLRLLADMVILAVLGMVFFPMLIVGALGIMAHAAIAHRRLLWRLD